MTKKNLISASIEDLEALKKVRKRTIRENFGNILSSEQVDCLEAQDPNTDLEKHITKGTVYLFKKDENLEGYAQMKFTPRTGDNGICTLESFCSSKEALDEGIFEENFKAIEETVKKAGCYKIKGVATKPELELLKRLGYSESAPSYRHTRNGVTINYFPFSKTLFFPEM